MLFLIVINSLLCGLFTSGLSLFINGLTIGFAAHADDIRSTSNSITDLQGSENWILSGLEGFQEKIGRHILRL